MTRRLDQCSLDFFTKGVGFTMSIQGFLESYAGLYLSKVYGELEVSEHKGSNFIHVYKVKTGYIVSDAVFSDPVPSLDIAANIYPKRIEFTTPRIIKTNCQLSNNLRAFGYGHLTHNIDIKSHISNIEFIRFSKDHQYESPREYIQFIKENPNDNTTIERLVPLRNEIFRYIKDVFKDNHLIQTNCVAETRVQKMGSGDSMIRHFGADKGEPYIMTIIGYYCPYLFEGRELYGGIRSDSDLTKYVSRFCEDDSFNSYSEPPQEYNDIYHIKPMNNSFAIVSAFNPVFYHAVNKHKGGGEVYAIITDIRLK